MSINISKTNGDKILKNIRRTLEIKRSQYPSSMEMNRAFELMHRKDGTTNGRNENSKGRQINKD